MLDLLQLQLFVFLHYMLHFKVNKIRIHRLLMTVYFSAALLLIWTSPVFLCHCINSYYDLICVLHNHFLKIYHRVISHSNAMKIFKKLKVEAIAGVGCG